MLAGFFSSAFDALFPPRKDARFVREAAEDALVPELRPTVIESTTPATTALFPFRAALVAAAIREAKYHANARAQALLGAALAEYLQELREDSLELPILVPLPLSRTRMRERGFNQCERILAEALRRTSDAEAVELRVLSRIRDTEHQTRLSRQARKENVRGAFCAQAIDPSRPYLVLDDVITTGATMQAAIDALRAAGARHIIPLALAAQGYEA